MQDIDYSIERDVIIEDIKIEPYKPASMYGGSDNLGWPAEGGRVESFSAYWFDEIEVIKDGKKEKRHVKTEFSRMEYDIFGDKIEEYIMENYSEEEPDFDDRED